MLDAVSAWLDAVMGLCEVRASGTEYRSEITSAEQLLESGVQGLCGSGRQKSCHGGICFKMKQVAQNAIAKGQCTPVFLS